ncbi:transcriptional regulator [Vibrio sp. Vb0932]|uniref:helix-turn-helix transcriptional regulator n=1 Tax=Vibrio sp. Vb0932 TaxID=3074633 RepID=UPI00398E8E4D
MLLKKLTKSDLDILNSMKNVVDGIARMYGEHTEVVLHSLDAEAPEIIKIANGHVTERSEGAPITNLARMKLREGKDVSDSYLTKTSNGKTLHSITTIVRNPKNKPIGLLCINVNLDAPFSQVLQSFMPTQEAKEAASSVNFASDVEELVDQTVERTIEEINADKSVSNNTKNRQIVMELYDKGIFDIKDAINRVADRLNISKHTVYLYIRQRKTEDE